MGPRKFEEVRSFLSGFVYVSLALIGKKTFHPMAKNLVFSNCEIFRGIQYAPFPDKHKYLGIGDIGQNGRPGKTTDITDFESIFSINSINHPIFEVPNFHPH